jgi:hypothetical protein
VGKHGSYPRVPRDLYPTPAWCIDALDEHVNLQGRRIWECAAGTGQMAQALSAHGAEVFSSDVDPHGCCNAVFDFLSSGFPPALKRFDGIVTNPAWGSGNRTAVAFIRAGLIRIVDAGGFLALLLPADFDSAVTRRELFHACPLFLARIILTARPVWFSRADGMKAAPKENVCWFVWAQPVLRSPVSPVVRYAFSRPANTNSHITPSVIKKNGEVKGTKKSNLAATERGRPWTHHGFMKTRQNKISQRQSALAGRARC